MNCERSRDEILLLAAGGLEESTANELRDHLRQCPRCDQSFAETEALLGQLGLTLPPVEPPQRLLKELRWRLSQQNSAPKATRSRPRYLRTAVWSAIAGATATTLVVHFLIGLPLREEVATLREERARQNTQIQELAGQVQFAGQRLSDLQTPHWQQIELDPGVAHHGGSAHVLVDSLNQQLHCYFFELPDSPQQKYFAWLRRPVGDAILIGEIQLDPQGQGALLVPMQGKPLVDAIIITRESSPAPSTPTDTEVFRGDLG